MNRGEVRRGEVWWVNFDPSLGGEIRKVPRPLKGFMGMLSQEDMAALEKAIKVQLDLR